MYSCFPTISFLVSYLLDLLTEVEKRPTRGRGWGHDKSGTTGKGGKGDKGKSGKDKPKPKPATKDDTVIVDKDKLDPAYDPYRCNTRLITAAN